MAKLPRAYDREFPAGATPTDIELICFRDSHRVENGGLGRFGHLRNVIDLTWNIPKRLHAAHNKLLYDPDKDDVFIWNEWTELMMQSFCDEQEIVVASGGGTWKTTTSTLYMLCLWLSSPHNTRVIITSTTGDGLRARAWKELTHFYRAINYMGNWVPSRTMLQTFKGDDGSGIYGVAVESDGSIEKAINKIVGRHNTNMAVLVDEMATVSGAIVEAATNLETGAERFQFIGTANPDSHFDPHGKMSEPEHGWDSISVDTLTWRTKRLGLGIHLHGRRSPRIGADDKFPGMLRERDIERTIVIYGEDSPQMWKQRIGFWAPEGIEKTVLSESLIQKFKAKEPAIWISGFEKAAGLDPAFEGEDRCVLQLAKYGQIDGGKVAIELGKRFIIKVKATDEEPIHYQIVRQVKEICISEGIGPERFGLDSTGEGGGLAAIFAKEWSNQIREIEFGGRASSQVTSETKTDVKQSPKKGFELYINRVTELWYGFRALVQSGRIRGLDDEAALEFCKRNYSLRGNMLVVEPKKEMKLRTNGKSSDLADAVTVVVAVIQLNDHSFAGIVPSEESSERWGEIARGFDVRNDYATSEEEEEYAGYGS